VILDVDGTLVDSNDAHARSWVQAFAEHGITVAYEDVRRAIGMGGDKLMPLVSGITDESDDGRRISSRRAEIFAQAWLPGLRPFPCTRELLQRFRDDGFTLAVASSAKKDELTLLLETAGVSDLISQPTSSDDAPSSKPDPDIVQAAMKRTGCAPGHAVLIGDTPTISRRADARACSWLHSSAAAGAAASLGMRTRCTGILRSCAVATTPLYSPGCGQ
jgi:phosphoglycolate phosphatase-like HAD superfamily hydrolase